MSAAASALARCMVMGRKDFSEPLITVVKLNGILQPASVTRGPQARRLLNLDRVGKWLSAAFNKVLSPAACVVTVNSPGGAPVQAELICSQIRTLSRQTGIPVWTFAEDVAASDGYWLLCAGDKVHACSTSIVGSIGVVSAQFDAVEAAQRLGVERRVFTAGPAKLQPDPFLPVTPDQEERLRDMMADLHESFKAAVRASRGSALSADEGLLFSGRPWTGRQALALGLVDALSSDYQATMKEAFGDRARFVLCSEPPQAGIRDLLGGRALAALGAGGSPDPAGPTVIEAMRYGVCRDLAGAALDEAEERALWARFGVQC